MTEVCKTAFKAKIDDKKYEIKDSQPTGRQLLDKSGNRPAEEFAIYVILENGLMEGISLDETIDLRERGVEKFITFETDRIFRFELDSRTFEWGANLITGLALKTLAQVDPDKYNVWLESRGPGENQLVENVQMIDLSADGLERFFTKKLDKTVTIIVEGTPHEWPKKEEICYEDVVKLEEPNPNPDTTYSIKYKKGRGNKPEGILSPNSCVKVKEGMVFSVSETGQS